MRSIATSLAASCMFSALVFGGPPAASAEAAESYVCWTASRADGPGATSQVIRCRIAGRALRDFSPEHPPPVLLLPAVGTDAAGGCWYRRSWWSGWSLVARYPDGSARLRYDPDGVPGGPVLADAVLPTCRSEPVQAPPDVEYAWRLLTSMYLVPSRVVVTPARPVSGLTTFLSIDLVPSHRRSLVSPVTGHRIEVHAAAGEVLIDWGDGSRPSRHDSADPALVAPRPEAAGRHTYEQSGLYDIVVQVRWEVRWRVDARPWALLPTEPIEDSYLVAVDQIVGRLARSIRLDG